MADDLEARLQSHAKSFEGLMSLLPPDLYYGKQNTGDEWNKKKQTKAEKKAAKRAKLDPANHKTAKDVADERDRKRRLEDEEVERAAAGLDAPLEQPMEGVRQPKAKAQKTAKDQDVHSGEAPSKSEKRKAKEAKLKEKKEKKKAKATEKRSKKEGIMVGADGEEPDAEVGAVEDDAVQLDQDMDDVDFEGLQDGQLEIGDESPKKSESPDPTFSPHADGTSSTTSSIPPSSRPEPAKQEPKPQKAEKQRTDAEEEEQEAKPSREELMARLHAKIEASRKARNADGPNGKPARSRSELMEARRLEQQKKKDKKKEARAEEKAAKEAAENEKELAKLRGSPSMGQELFQPRSRSASVVQSPGVENINNFSFGRVAFNDGTRIRSNLSGLREDKQGKGPSDAKTALLAAQKKQSRIAGLDAEKRADIEEKDVWLNARKRINGEKVRDDVNLLKKSLKRKEKQKSRSEKQWNERLDGVQKSQEARQRKREDNLAKRKEEKGSKGKKKVTKKPKRRPGFEGTFSGRG